MTLISYNTLISYTIRKQEETWAWELEDLSSNPSYDTH